MVEHKETCLSINGKRTVKLRNGSIRFKNIFKQFVVPFRIYPGFESVLKGVKSIDGNNNASYTRKYQAHISCSVAYKVVCIDDKLSKLVVLYRGENAAN